MLSAILFILFINDIQRYQRYSVFQHCKINLFADDTTIYIAGKDINELVELFNSDLVRFDEWLKINKLKLEINKLRK